MTSRSRWRWPLPWYIAWQGVRQYPRRTILTLCSVVISVAAVMAVGMSVGSARRAYRDMSRAVTGNADLEISQAGGGSFSQSLLKTVRQVGGVQAAVPVIQRPTILYHEEGRFRLVALGIDLSQDTAVREFEIVQGHAIQRVTDGLLDESLARSAGIRVGDEVRLLARRGRIQITISGLIRPRSGAAALGGVLILPLSYAQRHFARPQQIDRIQLVLADERQLLSVQNSIQDMLPAGMSVAPPPFQNQVAEETMMSFDNGLRLATAFSLLAALFIVLNSFLMSVGQRHRDLAIMRAVGATSPQIRGILVREALVLGLAGTSLGIPCGYVLAHAMNRAMSSLFLTRIPSTEILLLPLLLAVLFGVGVSLLGAWWPANKAARITPMEGIRGGFSNQPARTPWRLVLSGVLVVLAAITAFTASLSGWLAMENTVVAVIAMLLGLVMLLPAGIRPMASLVSSMLRPWIPVESHIACCQLQRHIGRTTLTAGVLFVTIATGLGLANSVLDNIADVRSWYRTAIAGDFFIRAANPDMETGMSAAMPESMVETLAGMDGLQRLESARLIATKTGETRVFVIASQVEFQQSMLSAQAESDDQDSNPTDDDAVRVGSVLAQRTKTKVGDHMTIDTPHGPQALLVSAISNDYMVGGLTLHMSRRKAERLFDVEGIDAFLITVQPEQRAAAQRALEELCQRHGLLLQSYAELTGMIEGMMAGVVASLWGLLFLGLCVAGLGMANTLGMNVLEQTRELGLLRVVGMTTRQVRMTIRAQALILGTLAIAPGIFAGMGMAYAMNLSTLPVLGHPVVHQMHLGLAATCGMVALLVVLVSSWLPARRAANLSLMDALRYE